MKCINCGKEISEYSKFCPECGARQNSEKQLNTIRMRCKDCGGVLLLEQNRSVLSCPYCGSKELIVENDAVKIERIKANAYKEVESNKINTYKDIELEKIQLEREKRASVEREKAATSFKKGLLSKLCIVLTVFYVLFVMTAFNDYRPTAGYIAIAQTILSVLGWLMGARILPERIPGLHVILIVISALLIYPFMNTYQ